MPSSSQDAHLAGGTNEEKERWDITIKSMLNNTNKYMNENQNCESCQTCITTRGDWEKYHSERPNRLSSAVLVSKDSEQRVLMMLPPTDTKKRIQIHHTAPIACISQSDEKPVQTNSYCSKATLRKDGPGKTCTIERETNEPYAQVTSANKSRPQFWPRNYPS